MDQARDLVVGLVDLLGRRRWRQIEKLIEGRLARLSQQAGHALPVKVGIEVQGALAEPLRDPGREGPQLVGCGAVNVESNHVTLILTRAGETWDLFVSWRC